MLEVLKAIHDKDDTQLRLLLEQKQFHINALLDIDVPYDLGLHRGKDYWKDKTVLMYAAHGSGLSCIKILIACGSDPNIQDSNGLTALMHFVSTSHIKTYLLSYWNTSPLLKYSNLSLVDNSNMSVLQHAINHGQYGLVQNILLERSDLFNKNTNGRTALFLMCLRLGSQQRTAYLRCLSLMLTMHQHDCLKTLFNEQDVYGRTPLMCILEQYDNIPMNVYEQSDSDDDEEGQRGVDGQYRGVIDNPIFHELPQLINDIIIPATDTSLADRSGCTALMIVMQSNATEHMLDSVFQRLLACPDCPVNARLVGNRMTALMFAIRNPFMNYECVDALINAGSDVNAVDSAGYTPLLYAIERIYPFQDEYDISIPCINLLLEKGASIHHGRVTPLILTIKRGHSMDIIQRVCDATVVNRPCTEGTSPLVWAIRRGRSDVVSYLLQQSNVRIDIKDVMCERRHDDARLLAACIIQRRFKECYYNPQYKLCHNRLMEEGEMVERDVKRLRSKKNTTDTLTTLQIEHP